MPHVRRQDGYPPQQYGSPEPSAPVGAPAHGEPPLPPELSPRRAAGGRVPRQADGGGFGGRPPYTGGGGGGRPANWRKRITYGVLALVVVLLGTAIRHLLLGGRQAVADVDLGALPDRPASGKGTNYLIVGSDSREGMSSDQKKQLHTGSADGKRTDSMMILHVGDQRRHPAEPAARLLRDHPGVHRRVAASTTRRPPTSSTPPTPEGGGALLAQTVEHNTGIHIDHYAEIGFTGFVNLVDALGGVDMCLDKPIVDKASGADFKAGCQKFNGAQSLEFVRERHQEADQDLGRMRNQQKFLATLAHQAASPSTVLNPFKLYPVLGAGLDTLEVDKDMGLYDLSQMFFAMKDVTGGNGNSMTVPIANANLSTASDGDAVGWDHARSQRLFDALKNDEEIPATGSTG